MKKLIGILLLICSMSVFAEGQKPLLSVFDFNGVTKIACAIIPAFTYSSHSEDLGSALNLSK